METTNNNPATKRQRFALWLASKACGEPKDFREIDLTVSQAAELLKQYNAKSGYNNGNDSTIQHNDQPRKQHNYKEEFIEFFKAKYLNEVLDNINNVLKQVSVVYNADIFGNPTGGQTYKFYGSGCACAWLEFRKCKRYEEIDSITGRTYNDEIISLIKSNLPKELITRLENEGCPIGAIITQDYSFRQIEMKCRAEFLTMHGAKNVKIRVHYD